MAGNIDIVEIGDPVRFVYIDSAGPYFETNTAFSAFLSNPQVSSFIQEPLRRISIWLDDPDVVPAQSLRSRLGVLIDSGINLGAGSVAGLQFAEIPPGRYVRMVVEGKPSELSDAWKFLYGVWLPHSEQSLRVGSPGFQIDYGVSHELNRCELYVEIAR